MYRRLLLSIIITTILIPIQSKTIQESNKTKWSAESSNFSPSYEVTEIIIDVPDDRPHVGPVTTNYIISKPLNHAVNNTELKTNKISVLQINAEYDDKNNENYSLIRGIKDYFHGIKNKVVKTVNNWLQQGTNGFGGL
uniref:Uncharacterized protein n=1 Tax=Bombyx mori TaxID=7091 RepID=A0A8R2R3B6_BOMMO|nr:uncharacterized protein LOC119629706 [Bombyx mori]